MNLKLLDKWDFAWESQVIGFYKDGTDAVLTFKDITDTEVCEITFKNVLINSDVEPRLAFDLSLLGDIVKSGNIELDCVNYGQLANGKYFFKSDLYHIPKEYFDYDKLGKKDIVFGGTESPVISFVADEMIVKIVNISTYNN